jgi:nucleotide-binding universal stress UspA family protein
MKNILVPTDFSIPALKALQFALDLALKIKASLMVCHIYQAPGAFTGDSEYMDQQIRWAAQKEMNTFLESVDSNSREAVRLKIILKKGHIVNELCRVIEENEITLVVMGTTGGKNILERFFGTTTESLIKRSLCPVLAIPEKYNFNPVENMVYASDFEKQEEISMMQLLQVKELFRASLTVLHVKSEAQPDRVDDEEIKANLKRRFPQENFRFVQIEDKEVAACLVKYVREQKNTLLAFTILHRPLWQKLFHSSVTSRLLHHLPVPMLAIPQVGRLLDLRNRAQDHPE